VDEAASYGSLEFNEVLDEEVRTSTSFLLVNSEPPQPHNTRIFVQVLKTKLTVVNRAPLMTAWATIVAERMGFQREEALSIGQVMLLVTKLPYSRSVE